MLVVPVAPAELELPVREADAELPLLAPADGELDPEDEPVAEAETPVVVGVGSCANRSDDWYVTQFDDAGMDGW